MKLPKEYRRYIGNYAACSSKHGRKLLQKFGYGPETEIVKEVVEEVKPPKKKATRKKKSTQ